MQKCLYRIVNSMNQLLMFITVLISERVPTPKERKGNCMFQLQLSRPGSISSRHEQRGGHFVADELAVSLSVARHVFGWFRNQKLLNLLRRV